VLVTGGTGSLGCLVAAWLSGQSVGCIHLVSRTGRLSPASMAALGQLLGRGSSLVQVSQCNAGSAVDVAAAMQPSAGSLPVQAVLHAGGTLSDALLPQQALRGIRQVYAPKVAALANLHQAQLGLPVVSQVLFSSVAALLGSPGQANYAAANAALDAAAQALQAQGMAAVSVQWGAWAGAGMAAQDAQTAARVERMGMAMIQPQRGLAALEKLVQPLGPAAAPQIAAVPFNWQRFLQRQPQPEQDHMFSEFVGLLPAAQRAAPALAAAPGAGDQQQLAQQVGSTVRSAVADLLGGSIGADEPLMAAGLDSLGSVELRNALEGRLQLQLPSTLVFDYPTVSALTSYISARVAASRSAVAAAASEAAAPAAVQPLRQPLVAAQLPAAALHVALVAAVARAPAGISGDSLGAADSIVPVPLSRWDPDSVTATTRELQVNFGSFLTGDDGLGCLAGCFCTPGLGQLASARACLGPCHVVEGCDGNQVQAATQLRCHRSIHRRLHLQVWRRLTPPPLACRMGRLSSWTHSSACCWRPPGRR